MNVVLISMNVALENYHGEGNPSLSETYNHEPQQFGTLQRSPTLVLWGTKQQMVHSICGRSFYTTMCDQVTTGTRESLTGIPVLLTFYRCLATKVFQIDCNRAELMTMKGGHEVMSPEIISKSLL